MSEGTVFDGGGLRLVDLREVPWEEHPGIPGARARVLAHDPAGWPSVLVTWVPPGLAGREGDRHFHRSVLERGLVLSGELPIREFADVEDTVGRPLLYREGHFYDRAPGSVHGLDWEATSAVGCEILEWRTGPGTYLSEPDAAAETTVLHAGDEVGTES